MHRPVPYSWAIPRRTLHGASSKVFYNCYPTDHPTRMDFDSDLAKYGIYLQFHPNRLKRFQHQHDFTENAAWMWERIRRMWIVIVWKYIYTNSMYISL